MATAAPVLDLGRGAGAGDKGSVQLARDLDIVVVRGLAGGLLLGFDLGARDGARVVGGELGLVGLGAGGAALLFD